MSIPTDHASWAFSRYAVWLLRRNPALKDKDDQQRALVNFVLDTELKAGSILVLSCPEKVPYLVEGLTRNVFEIGKNSDEFLAYLLFRYGLQSEDWLTLALVSSVKSTAILRGRKRVMRRFAVWKDQTLYLSRYNGRVWALNGTTIIEEANGDTCLFADDDGGEVPAEPDIGPHGILLPTLTSLSWSAETPGGMTPQDQQRALTAWIFAIAFPDLLRSKPALVIEGSPGSGKSSAIGLIQEAIHGRWRALAVSETGERDFPIQLLRTPIAFLDNVDGFIKWIPDAVCSYSTGGGFTKRALYANDKEHEIKPQSFIAVASKNPASFRREDTADRSIILRLDRYTTFTNDAELLQRITDNRNKLYGEWIHYLTLIVGEIRTNGMPIAGPYRMADWASFARVVGKVFGWAPDAVDAMMLAMQRERDAFAGEGDSFLELIQRWMHNNKNRGRWVTASVLHSELNAIAEATKKPFPKSPNAIAQKMRAPYITSQYDIQTRIVSGGAKAYAITLKGVEEEEEEDVPEGVLALAAAIGVDPDDELVDDDLIR